jgi:hypothetical protein
MRGTISKSHLWVAANLAVLVENIMDFEEARAHQVQLERERDHPLRLLVSA